jgi:hypothetical protein
VTAPYPPAAVQLPDKKVLVLNGSTVASFGNAEAPPPNAVAIAQSAAVASTLDWSTSRR